MQLPQSPNSTHAILNLLSQTCDLLLDPWDPNVQDPGYVDAVQKLEAGIDATDAPLVSMSRSTFIVGLYRVATRIYLARASRGPWEPRESFDLLIDSLYSGPIRSCNKCGHFFPLIILACEARTDEHRASISKLIERTGRDRRFRSVIGLRAAVQSIWIQQDLHRDGEMVEDYVGILNTAISSTNIAMSLA